MTTTTHTIKTRSRHPFGLVQVTRTGSPALNDRGELRRQPVERIDLVGYSATYDAGIRRARKLSGGRYSVEVRPIEAGRITIEVDQ